MCRPTTITPTRTPTPVAPMRQSKRRRRRSVSFGSVNVREYERIAGDNPAVPEGPSMSLGWGFVENKSVSVKKYENTRDRASTLTPLTAETRKFILTFVFDVSEKDLKRSEKAVERVKKQRSHTLAKMTIKKKNVKRTLPVTDTKKEEQPNLKQVEDPLPRQRRRQSGRTLGEEAKRRLMTRLSRACQ